MLWYSRKSGVLPHTNTTLTTTTRHLRNRSGQDWRVFAAVFVDVGVETGATYVGTTSAGQTEWLIEDGGILEVGYDTLFIGGEPDPTSFQAGYGTWWLMDHNNVYTYYDWEAEGFFDPIPHPHGYIPETLCPYIKHDGATPAMNLNYPADGDIDIWGADFYA